MADLLSAAMLAELDSEDCQAAFVLDLFLPGGTKKYSDQDRLSTTLGQYVGKIVTWGDTVRAASKDQVLLLPQLGDTTIEDTDQDFNKIVGTYGAEAVRGSRALQRLVSPRVPPADWFTAFDGLLSTWRTPRDRHRELVFNAKDQPLKGSFPKIPILPSDFPNVEDKSLYAQWVPLPYGIHDSRGSGDGGMVPCNLVDRLRNRYLVALGWVAVTRVYKDDVLQGSGFSIVYTTIGGRLYTLIEWSSSIAPSVVAADIIGYESVGDGSGTVLTGVRALKHLVVNFLWGDSQGGLWLSDSTAPVSTALFAEAQAWLAPQGWDRVSRVYGGDRQTVGIDAINEFCKGLVHPFFTWDGLLGVAVDDHHPSELYHDGANLIRWDRDLVGQDSWKLTNDEEGICDRVALSYLYATRAGKYLQTSEVRDLSRTEESSAPLQLPWSHAGLI